MNRTAVALAFAAAFAVASTPLMAQQKKTVLSLDTAKKMAQACVDKATAEGWKMNVAILDDGGNLKAFVRMDGAFLGSIQIAQLKANTSASFPFSTKQVGEIVQTRVPGLAFVPGLLTFEGGSADQDGGRRAYRRHRRERCDCRTGRRLRASRARRSQGRPQVAYTLAGPGRIAGQARPAFRLTARGLGRRACLQRGCVS